MASVPVSHVVLFIAIVGVSAVIAGTMTSTSTGLSDAVDAVGEKLSGEIATDVEIVSDPGGDALYEGRTENVTLLVRNTGTSSLPADPDQVEVLLDGDPVTAETLTVVDGDRWAAGSVAKITVNRSLALGEHRAVVSVQGNRDVLTFPVRGDAFWLDPSAEPGTFDCDDRYCSVDASATTSLDLAMDTGPTQSGVTVDYTVNDTSVSTVAPSAGTTDGAGENATTLSLDSAGWVEVTLGTSFDDDTIFVHVTNTSGRIYDVVFVNDSAATLSTIDRDGGTETVHLAEVPSEVGPGRATLDDDGAREIPFVENGTGDLRMIGFGEETVETLDDSGAVDAHPVGVGDYDQDGADEVYYARGGDLVAVRANESVTTVAGSSSFGDPLRAVGGVADFDGDSSPEVVFADDAGDLGYVDDDGSVVATGYTSLGSSHAIGRPADFDSDGEVRVPVVTAAGEVALVNATGGETVLNASWTQAAADSVAAHDIDGDDALEVVVIDTSDRLHAVELDGTHAPVERQDGAVVSARAENGAA